MILEQLKPNVIVRGPILPEPVQVIVTVPMGESVKLIGKGLTTGSVHEPILNAAQLAQLTATPDKEPFDGDPLKFRLGIEAMRRNSAPFYLRRTKEALISFPDPTTGKSTKLFTDRDVRTSEFQIDDDEWDFYDALTRFVEDRQEQIAKRLPDDYEDLPEEEQQQIADALEEVVASVDPAAMKEEILQLGRLIDQARSLEQREIESKLVKLKEVLTDYGAFGDPKMKLLIFTEHKDTLDYLAGDGKEGRPLGKLREWGLSVTQIHGSMKIGDRDTPGSRIYAEREFRDEAQVLVATEAAGEGINLQFCWFMINYASIKHGRGNHLHRKLFVVQTDTTPLVPSAGRGAGGEGFVMSVREPTVFLDLSLAPQGTQVPSGDDLPDRRAAELVLIDKALAPLLSNVSKEREHEMETISRHVEISLNELIHRQNLRMAAIHEQAAVNPQLLEANIEQVEDRLFDLNSRLDRRREELKQERQCTIGDIQHVGCAWVLPHPERTAPAIAPMVRDDEIERIAVRAAIAHEEARGWQVESVEDQNRGFDLISRRPHPEDPKTCIEVRFIEVKGRAGVGEVALTTNEYKTAERLKKDYWLYVVFNCATRPEIHAVQDPARLGWEPLVTIEHYHVGAQSILRAAHGEVSP